MAAGGTSHRSTTANRVVTTTERNRGFAKGAATTTGLRWFDAAPARLDSNENSKKRERTWLGVGV